MPASYCVKSRHRTFESRQGKQISIYEARCRREFALAVKNELAVAPDSSLARTRDGCQKCLGGIASRVRDLAPSGELAPEVVAASSVREAHDCMQREFESLLHAIADDLMKGGIE